MYKQLKKMRQEEGFTLIELLIVIVILGILAAIVVFSVQGITDKGKTSACKSNVAEVQTAIQAFFANNATNSWPRAYDAAGAITAAQALVPQFLQSDPPATDVTVVFDATGATAPTVTSLC
jgi:general secretion pathway protein G